MTERVQEVNRLQKVLASASSKLAWGCQLACPPRYGTPSSSAVLQPSNRGHGWKVTTRQSTNVEIGGLRLPGAPSPRAVPPGTCPPGTPRARPARHGRASAPTCGCSRCPWQFPAAGHIIEPRIIDDDLMDAGRSRTLVHASAEQWLLGTGGMPPAAGVLPRCGPAGPPPVRREFKVCVTSVQPS